MITLKEVNKTYQVISDLAFEALKNNNVDLFINHADNAAKVASMFNWIYVDNKFENTFDKIALQNIETSLGKFDALQSRIIFYDSIGSVACLTIQYLKQLIESGYKVLYIFESSTRKLSPQIADLVKAHEGNKLVEINSKTDSISKLNLIYKHIIEWRPEWALIQTPAEGAFSSILWSAFKDLKKYRIVPGDHHFYFGVKCTDYFFEFRNYGYTVAIEKRGVEKEKILIQPYYPLVDNLEFEGFPIDTKGLVKIFSAGSPYKIYGEKGKYFEIIKYLLDKYPNTVLFYAGGGFLDRFQEFIKVNKFENRIFLIGYRKDLNQFINNSDVYLCTYPLTGGLIGQIAAYYGKPLLSYSDDKLKVNIMDDIIQGSDIKKKITINSLYDFYKYADKLIIDKEYRIEEGLVAKRVAFTKNDFKETLKKNILLQKTVDPEIININYEASVQTYLELENLYFPGFRMFMLLTYRKKLLTSFRFLLFDIFFSRLVIKSILKRVK